MKIDKEQLIKHRFWVLLGVFVPLMLFAILWEQTAVEGAVESERKKITDHRARLEKNASQAKLPGQTEMMLCNRKEKTLKERRTIVWQQEWDRQKTLIFWPAKVRDAYADIRFGDPVRDEVRTTFAQTDVYLAQYEDMAKTFQTKVPLKDPKTRKPIIDPKTGKARELIIEPVRFEGGWHKVLRPVEKWKVLPPLPEEAWLAQEDVWVRHELLQALKQANASVARFQVAGKGPGDQGPPFEQMFKNPYWQIELNLYPKDDQQYYVKGKITNIGKKRQALGRAYFRLQVQRDEKEARVVLPIEGEARPAGESWEIKETPLDLLQNPAGLFGLEQILEPRTAPVRRIDDIELYYHSHRTYEPALLPPKQFGGGNPPPSSPNPAAPPGSSKSSPTTASTTPNGLVIQRYTDVTDQVRRMPLALVVIADQAHIPEVLTALSNSILRMQITQYNWQHFRGSLEEEKPQPKSSSKNLNGPRDSKEAGAAVEEQQKNLVELSIYGIVSLYDRPDKQGDAAKTPVPEARNGKK